MPIVTKPVGRQRLEDQVMDRAARDPEFRRALIADPRATLKRELNFEYPQDTEFTVMEEGPSQVYLVLPPHMESGSKLVDDDLEQVAGGDPTYPWPPGSC